MANNLLKEKIGLQQCVYIITLPNTNFLKCPYTTLLFSAELHSAAPIRPPTQWPSNKYEPTPLKIYHKYQI